MTGLLEVERSSAASEIPALSGFLGGGLISDRLAGATLDYLPCSFLGSLSDVVEIVPLLAMRLLDVSADGGFAHATSRSMKRSLSVFEMYT